MIMKINNKWTKTINKLKFQEWPIFYKNIYQIKTRRNKNYNNTKNYLLNKAKK